MFGEKLYEQFFYLNSLLGSQLIDIGHAADMVWWIFKTNEHVFALHSQCSCRIHKNHVQIFTRSSIYYNIEDTDKTIFDYQIDNLKKNYLPLKVLSIVGSDCNDILINFSGEVKAEIIADQPTGYEQWRLFPEDKEGLPDLVAYTDKMEF